MAYWVRLLDARNLDIIIKSWIIFGDLKERKRGLLYSFVVEVNVNNFMINCKFGFVVYEYIFFVVYSLVF